MRVLVRFLLVFAVLSGAAVGDFDCGYELSTRWNKFAGDANRYVAKLNAGVVDVKLRGQIEREWRGVTTCGCW